MPTSVNPFFELPLTQGFVALVDEADRELVEKYKWQAHQSMPNYWYAKANARNSSNAMVRLHRLITGLSVGDKRVVDHINGNPLDNRRSNLRIVSQRVNTQNRNKPHGRSTTGYVGVERTHYGRFMARICRNGKRIGLGVCKAAEDAATLYAFAAEDYNAAA